MSTILIVGYKGEYGRKIYNQLAKNNLNNITGVDTDNLCELQKNIEYDFCLIITPPSTHVFYINYIIKHQLSKNILCEKPIIDTNNIKGDTYKIIDHYLYKNTLQDIENFYKKNFNDIKIIKFRMNEKRNEERSWMILNKNEGGVTLDMGHHLIAIFGYLIGFENLIKIKDIKAKKVDYFNNCSMYCDEHVSLSFKYKHIFVDIEYGKNLINEKKVTFSTSKKEMSFSLTGNVDYNLILSDQSKLLSTVHLSFINDVLTSIRSLLNI